MRHAGNQAARRPARGEVHHCRMRRNAERVIHCKRRHKEHVTTANLAAVAYLHSRTQPSY